MTRLEKAKELNPEMTEGEIIEYCPEQQLPIDPVACPISISCFECWNEEYKEGEQI